jgi:hypothetical protein
MPKITKPQCEPSSSSPPVAFQGGSFSEEYDESWDLAAFNSSRNNESAASDDSSVVAFHVNPPPNGSNDVKVIGVKPVPNKSKTNDDLWSSNDDCNDFASMSTFKLPTLTESDPSNDAHQYLTQDCWCSWNSFVLW